ncbi:MAG TPA: hypothetical protein VEZ11_00850, partial [Thermoanaerobaculia bacterium]|nr:hypothetical protein [Thermoanaerobaculia bacterium]
MSSLDVPLKRRTSKTGDGDGDANGDGNGNAGWVNPVTGKPPLFGDSRWPCPRSLLLRLPSPSPDLTLVRRHWNAKSKDGDG